MASQVIEVLKEGCCDFNTSKNAHIVWKCLQFLFINGIWVDIYQPDTVALAALAKYQRKRPAYFHHVKTKAPSLPR